MSTKSPMRLYSDNKATISMAHNPVHNDRHFIRQKIESGEICIPHVSSAEETIDILTKGSQQPFFEKMLSKRGLFDVYNPTRKGVLKSFSLRISEILRF